MLLLSIYRVIIINIYKGLQPSLIYTIISILLGVKNMSHHDKKFEEESQDARRRDQHEEEHPDEKRGKHIVKPTDKDKYTRDDGKK